VRGTEYVFFFTEGRRLNFLLIKTSSVLINQVCTFYKIDRYIFYSMADE